MGDIFSQEALAAIQGATDSGAGGAADASGTPAGQQPGEGDGGKPSNPGATPEGQQPDSSAAGGEDGTGEGAGEQEPAKPFFEFKGRAFKDANELMATMEASQKEALRLKGAERQLKTLSASQQDLMVKHRAELAKIQLAQFQNARFPGEKSVEEIEAMSPEQRNAYYQERANWSVSRESEKKHLEAAVVAENDRMAHIQQEIERATDEMLNDPETYPDFEVLTPTINALSKDFPFTRGNPDTPRLLYLAAMGARAIYQQSQAKKLGGDSQAEAKKKAAADAAARGGGLPASAKKTPASSKHDDAVAGMVAAYRRAHGTLG